MKYSFCYICAYKLKQDHNVYEGVWANDNMPSHDGQDMVWDGQLGSKARKGVTPVRGRRGHSSTLIYS